MFSSVYVLVFFTVINNPRAKITYFYWKDVCCIISFCDIQIEKVQKFRKKLSVLDFETAFFAKTQVYIYNLGLSGTLSTRIELFFLEN